MICRSIPATSAEPRFLIGGGPFLGNPVFLGKTARILSNSQGTHGIHRPLTTLKVSGFPTSPKFR